MRVLIAYIASLKPKTVVLPERWLTWYGAQAGAFYESEAAARGAAARNGGYVRHIPATEVEAK